MVLGWSRTSSFNPAILVVSLVTRIILAPLVRAGHEGWGARFCASVGGSWPPGGDLQRGGGSGTPSACSLSICRRFADADGLAAGVGAVAEAGLEEKRSEKPPGVCRNRAPAPPELLPLPVCLCVCLCVFVSVCLTTAPLPGRTAGCRSAVEEPRLPRRLCSPVSDLPLGDQWLLQVSGVSFSLPCRVDVLDLQG